MYSIRLPPIICVVLCTGTVRMPSSACQHAPHQHMLQLQARDAACWLTRLAVPLLADSSPCVLLVTRTCQVESFAQGLQQHQLATLPDGSTVLERSVTEHNLEAASKL